MLRRDKHDVGRERWTMGAAPPPQLFTRVVVGVDRSPESREAARQAAVLTDPEGTLTVLAAWMVPPPTLGVVSPDLSRELDTEAYHWSAEAAARDAENALTGLVFPTTKVVHGIPSRKLLEEIERERDTLVVVGSHGQGRMRGILLGSTATELVHRAPCSVLVARAADEHFPSRITVGLDGSPEAYAAYAAACQLASRFGSTLRPLVARGGKTVDSEALAALADSYEDVREEPVQALVVASSRADLIVLGSRGVHGLKALGSVSERVAHQSRCSTLIVRVASF
jgi:nucleotide-binding universal stress UspA family protein